MGNELGVTHEFVVDLGLEVIAEHGLGFGTLFEQTLPYRTKESSEGVSDIFRRRQAGTQSTSSILQFHHHQTRDFFVVFQLFQILRRKLIAVRRETNSWVHTRIACKILPPRYRARAGGFRQKLL